MALLAVDYLDNVAAEHNLSKLGTSRISFQFLCTVETFFIIY